MNFRKISRRILALTVIASLLLMPVSSSAKLAAQVTGSGTAGEDFSDVPTNHPFAKTIGELKAQGLVKGYGDGTFAPDASVSRAEFITMVMAAVGGDLKGANCFKDVKDEWFAKFVCSAKARGLVKGYADGTFKPANNINFAEASAVTAKAYTLGARTASLGEPWYKPSIAKLALKKAIPTTIDYVEKKLSRAETGEMMYRLKNNVTTKPTKTYTALVAPLPQIASCAELSEKFAAMKYRDSRQYYGFEKMAIPMATMQDTAEGEGDEEAAPPSEGEGDRGLGGAGDYSSTNVQVAGVDEADIIKNDGTYIYIVSPSHLNGGASKVRVVKAYPPEELTEVAGVEFDDKNFTPEDLFVTDERLVVMGSTYTNAENDYRTRAKVYILNKTNLANLKLTLERTLEFDGYTLSSRRVGNWLYLVTNHSPNYYRILEDSLPTAEALPHYKDSNTGKDKPVVGCTGVRFFPTYDEMNFVTVASVNLADAAAPIDKEVVMGAGSTIYATARSLYVAATKYEYPTAEKFDVWFPPASQAKTVLFRFGIENGDVTFKTKGEVKGTLLNQFSMDEEGDAFRIATTTEPSWGGPIRIMPLTVAPGAPTIEPAQEVQKNHLFILDANNLETTLGKIENIAPGERIYSVRFLGKRAYMVTFKKIDPFFVIDVEDPKNPRILGELKIPGYSDYLHPFDENHIIGFGKEAVDPAELEGEGVAPVFFRDFAWYQGMKIALFDVTDTANPKVLFQEVIGDRGTESELLHNHKALLFDKARGLFAFPVNVAEVKEEDKERWPNQDPGSVYGTTVFQGAYVYTLDLEKGFQLKGRVTHFDLESGEKLTDYWYGDKNTISRIVYIGDYLYTISAGKIKAVKRSDVSEVKALTLPISADYSEPPILE